MIVLDPTAEQISLFESHGAAARIARNDLIALWREEGKRLPGFRYGTSEPRPLLNKTKFKAHPWFKDFLKTLSKACMPTLKTQSLAFIARRTAAPAFTARAAALPSALTMAQTPSRCLARH